MSSVSSTNEAIVTYTSLELVESKKLVGPERVLASRLLRSLEQISHGVLAVRNSPEVVDGAQTELLPDLRKSIDKVVNVSRGVARGRRHTQSLKTSGNGREVDGLNIAAVLFEQYVTGSFGLRSVTDKDGHNVRRVVLERDASSDELVLGLTSADLLKDARVVGRHENLNCLVGAGKDRRREGGGEDELRSKASDQVDEAVRAGNVTTDVTISLAERTSDDVDTIHDATLEKTGFVTLSDLGIPIEVFGDTGATRAVHADSVDFVEESDGAVLLSKLDGLLDRTNGTAHGVDRFESDDLGHIDGDSLKLGLEITISLCL